jgi:hypothetical protein
MITNGKKLNSSVNKTGVNMGMGRTSAPIFHDKISLYHQEKNKIIADKLYMPFITDKMFKIDVNNKLTRIKQDSKNNAIFTHKLIKKKDEVEKIGKQLFIFNNPSKNLIFNILKFI